MKHKWIGILAAAMAAFVPMASLAGCGVDIGIYENADAYTAGDGQVAMPKHLEIYWTAGAVEIVPYDGDQLRFTERTDNPLPSEGSRLHYLQDGDTLCIRYAGSGFQWIEEPHKTLTVSVPKDATLESLQVQVISANAQCEGISVKELLLETVSGEIAVQADNVQTCRSDGVSGNVTLRLTGTEVLQGKSVSGEIIAALDKSISRIEMETVSGDVIVSLPKDGRYCVNLDTVSGDFTSAIPVLTGDGQEGAVSIFLKSVSGDLILKDQADMLSDGR